MEVSVIARHMEISEGVRGFAEKKVGNLDRLFSDLTQIEIVLDAADGGHSAELIAHQNRGEKFVAESRAPDMYQAITAVIDKMDHQLRKRKEILRRRRKKAARGAPLPGEEEEAAFEEESEDVAEAEDI